jgi:aspartyl-tRNA(Asn)/glutamyl-tRNA(Gln) amidotransferase subunit A
MSVPTLARLAQDLVHGKTTSEKLVEDCLARIADPAGEGATSFVHVAQEQARITARAMDQLRKAGAAPSAYAGIPVSIKDLFDIAGEQTRAGSLVLKDVAPAAEDAAVVARFKAAGFIVIGRTNMTEFAFSGIGINPHYGTPKNIFDRKTARVPGGSSSGAAISITDQMSYGALGTDTGGSCRIPAAFNAIVGYKPTAKRIPMQGAFPLSTTLDSIGPLAHTVSCCAVLDAALSGEPLHAPTPRHPKGLRIAIPKAYVMNDMDADVAAAFSASLKKLADAGAIISEIAFPEIDAIPSANAKGGFAAPESLSSHSLLIEKHADLYDKRVLSRIQRGHEQSAVDFIQLVRIRAQIIRDFEKRMADYDCLAYPTVPIIAPPIAALADDAEFTRLNLLVLRNPSVFNFLDGCAISVPMTRLPAAPSGLMLACPGGQDAKLFTLAAGVEALLA